MGKRVDQQPMMVPPPGSYMVPETFVVAELPKPENKKQTGTAKQ